MDANELTPDEDVIADRRPTHCPFCGAQTAFDGHGRKRDKLSITSIGSERGSDTKETFDTEWQQHRCPECNGTFRMLVEAWEV